MPGTPLAVELETHRNDVPDKKIKISHEYIADYSFLESFFGVFFVSFGGSFTGAGFDFSSILNFIESITISDVFHDLM